jgi:hypothetical protein
MKTTTKNSDQTIIFCNLPNSDDNELHLNTWGSDQNVNSKIEAMEGVFSSIPDRFMDFLDIATFVYCGDQAISRGQKIVDNYGDLWYRGLHFVIGVRDLVFWQRDDVHNKLEDVLSFLSGECISFDFKKLEQDRARDNYLDFVGKWEEDEKPNQVMLYSGGIDSLGGAILEALDHGKRLVLVRHRPSNKFINIFNQLDAGLAAKCPNKPLFLNLEVNKDKGLTKEYTQRTRSFLYFSLAATAAYLLGLDHVKFYENGPVSINLPLLDQVIGSQSTRTTHPRVLCGFRDIASLIAERPFKVENPFILKTKAEVVEIIIQRKCNELIPLSISCAHANFGHRSNAKPQCGACSQCIDRRFAFESRGWASDDPTDRYCADFFHGGIYSVIKKEEDQATLVGYIDRALRISQMDFQDFVSKYPQVTRAAKYLPPNSTAAAQELFRLYKRHAQEVMQVCEAQVQKNQQAIMLGTLPSDCLARLVVDNPAYAVRQHEPPQPIPYIERVDEKGGIEIWKVNGEAKKLTFQSNSIPYKFLCILYNLYVANPGGWIPHDTFIQQSGWKEDRYFGKGNGDNGLMHRRLTDIRKCLGINISFDKKNGCRIVPPVKS